MLSVLIASLGLSLLVIVHEAGHYLVARAFGIRVIRFSIGFGPVVMRYQAKDGPTVFQVCAIPFLAYVMYADAEEDRSANDPDLYANKGVVARLLTVLGGPLANYLAAALMIFALALGGFSAGDAQRSAAGQNVVAVTELAQQRLEHAASLAVSLPWDLTVQNIDGIAEMIRRGSAEGIAGPVGMGKIVAQHVEQGVSQLVWILVVISVSLGFFNLLPLPALDGGKLLFLGYELITRRKPNQRVEAAIHAAGLVLLLGASALVTYRDIVG